MLRCHPQKMSSVLRVCELFSLILNNTVLDVNQFYSIMMVYVSIHWNMKTHSMRRWCYIEGIAKEIGWHARVFFLTLWDHCTADIKRQMSLQWISNRKLNCPLHFISSILTTMQVIVNTLFRIHSNLWCTLSIGDLNIESILSRSIYIDTISLILNVIVRQNSC